MKTMTIISFKKKLYMTEIQSILISELHLEVRELKQKIQKLIDAGDVMYKLIDPPSISMRTTEYDNALQGWDDAKIKP